MAKPEYSYLTLTQLKWLQAEGCPPVKWNKRIGQEGSIDCDDLDAANGVFHDLGEFKISNRDRPLSAEDNSEPVHATLPIDTVQSKSVRKVLLMRRDYEDAAYDQRVSRLGQPDLADGEVPVTIIIGRPSLAA